MEMRGFICPPDIGLAEKMRREREIAFTKEPRRAGKSAPDAKSDTVGTREYAASPVSQTSILVPQPSKIACFHNSPSRNPLRSSDSFHLKGDPVWGVFRGFSL
jgi:hypothetical protein